LIGAFVCACTSSPTAPQIGPLAIGRWSTTAGQCLTVTEPSCNFVSGCGHGVFPRPTVAADGTFEVDGITGSKRGRFRSSRRRRLTSQVPSAAGASS
jgi:hypothetical protein